MNTDRDNFHDWARDKPDTKFEDLDRGRSFPVRESSSFPWGRVLWIAVTGVLLVMLIRFVAGH